jgi:glutathione synthase/RimK-type ligase-like ATP-grasp enzyme
MRIALATCLRPPEPDPDEALVLSALRSEGVQAQVLAWDDPHADFGAWDLVVLRSTWNYHEDVDAFLAWADRTSRVTRLRNGADVIRWNAKKSYLRELAARGVAVVPTEFVAQGETLELEALLASRGWDRVVIKPVVSAGSFRTASFTLGESREAARFLEGLVRDRDAMIQPYMSAVETYGERSLVFVDGELTHAVRKSPRLAGAAESVSGAVAASAEERAFAERVLAASGAQGLLYARVDTIKDGDTLRVMELELVEPSLFLVQSPHALARFVRALTQQARAA